MSHTNRGASSARRNFLSIALFAGIACTAGSPDPTAALVAWAEHAPPQAVNKVTSSVETTFVDYFGAVPISQWKGRRDQSGLAANGLDLPTAGAGSTWVYDPVHHIAAVTFGGEQVGNSIMYADPPPSKIPSRDLSGVVSARGLKLGVTPMQAVTDLGVTTAAVQQVDAHYSALSVKKSFECHFEGQFTTCGHYADVIFHDGHATYISFADPGP